MAIQIFTGNVIALIWDFDQTLIPGYQQTPLFRNFNVDESEFWREVDALSAYYGNIGVRISRDTIYLNHILTYVKHGRFKGLSNSMLFELGGKLTFYDGLPDFFVETKEHISNNSEFAKHNITLEHYVVSTGLRQMILGSSIANHVDDVWASEFIEKPAPPDFLKSGVGPYNQGSAEISQIGYFLDNTTKTRAIWEINKGANKENEIDVNALIAHGDRRVPIRNMIYVADGPSDIPVFSIVNQYGGRTLGVYNPKQQKHFDEVKRLSDQGRVQHFTPADYSQGSNANFWIIKSLSEIGQAIVTDRKRALADRVGPPSRHVVD